MSKAKQVSLTRDTFRPVVPPKELHDFDFEAPSEDELHHDDSSRGITPRNVTPTRSASPTEQAWGASPSVATTVNVEASPMISWNQAAASFVACLPFICQGLPSPNHAFVWGTGSLPPASFPSPTSS